MDWQQTISLALVLVTAALFIRGAVKRRARRAATCDHCAMNPQRAKKTI